MQRWDGAKGTHDEWDGLRKDAELWDLDGDCLVHLYAQGNSRRGPSIRVSSRALHEAHCGPLFESYALEIPRSARIIQPEYHCWDSRSTKYEFYIPAPAELPQDGAFLWHITTRNFFAFILKKPLVGTSLGKALVELQDRMPLFRSESVDSKGDIRAYAERMGYLDFVNCPDHALALLHYAESFQLHDLWVDAFAHCVGMNANLHLSSEFHLISRVTKALVMRAYLEMDIRISNASSALDNFLEDELSSSNLGLSLSARQHLDRFRSFLHSFYVEKYGYWPPRKESRYPKSLYKSLYFDFHSLYDLLVDRSSGDSMQTPVPPSGGICVLQNVQVFNSRHKCSPLPHALPLLPQPPPAVKWTATQKALPVMRLRAKQTKAARYRTICASMMQASNPLDRTAAASSLVTAYKRFELEWAITQEEKVSVSDARKVRWLLIYATLQMLASAVRAPREVRDTDTSAYPLCCLVTSSPPWISGTKTLLSPEAAEPDESDVSASPSKSLSSESLLSVPGAELDPRAVSPISIHPDCEDREPGPHSSASSKRHSANSETLVGTPRTTSLKSTKTVSTFSSVSSRRNSRSRVPSARFCEIMIHGYGNGLNHTKPNSSTTTITSREASPDRSVYSTSEAPQSHEDVSVNAAPVRELRSKRLPAALALTSFSADDVSEHSSTRTPHLNNPHLDMYLSLLSDVPSSASSVTTPVSERGDFNTVWTDDGASSVSSRSSVTYNPSRHGGSEDSGSPREPSKDPAIPLPLSVRSSRHDVPPPLSRSKTAQPPKQVRFNVETAAEKPERLNRSTIHIPSASKGVSLLRKQRPLISSRETVKAAHADATGPTPRATVDPTPWATPWATQEAPKKSSSIAATGQALPARPKHVPLMMAVRPGPQWSNMGSTAWVDPPT